MADRDKRTRRTRRKTKDRVLQARIPEDLDEELRDRAEQLGISVSTVVRNVLLHTFDLVEGVVSDSAQIARAIQGRESRPATPSLPAPEPADSDADIAVIGWQEAILNRNGVCEQCNTILAKGETAAVGVPVQARPVLLCLACLGNLTSTDTAGDES
jgi:hypothetical protein